MQDYSQNRGVEMLALLSNYFEIKHEKQDNRFHLPENIQRGLRAQIHHSVGIQDFVWSLPFLCLPPYLLTSTHWDRPQTLVAFTGKKQGCK